LWFDIKFVVCTLVFFFLTIGREGSVVCAMFYSEEVNVPELEPNLSPVISTQVKKTLFLHL
jgi:hypothetical protein